MTKIAVPYLNEEIFGHFGKSTQFKIYTVQDNAVTDAQVVNTAGAGHGALVDFLQQQGVNTLLCGGIGGVKASLEAAGMQVYGGLTGRADDAVQSFLSGTLAFDPNIKCSHHGDGEHQCHGHDHSQGHSGCCGHHS